MSQTLVIIGASGDLTSRKLIPALYRLWQKERLPGELDIVGFSRTQFSDSAWRDALRESTSRFVGDAFDPEVWQGFAEHIHYHAGDLTRQEDVDNLAGYLADGSCGSPGQKIFYLATSPRFYAPAARHLGSSSLAGSEHGPPRIVIEKPFGTDLATARELNNVLHEAFAEEQIYRIDHYLGKETVQNLMVLRFANSIFEPVWNRNYVDHVQITVAEEVEIGNRAGYYDRAGVLRDMFQNHLLQLLSITAMEAPVRFAAGPVRDEKVKVLEAVRPMNDTRIRDDAVFGQFAGYIQAPGVAPDSRTPTFAGVKLWIDNWRWQSVPFYLRSGKAMSCRTTQIVIQFRQPPHMLFDSGPTSLAEANRLVVQIQPAEGIELQFQTKIPDGEMRLRLTKFDFDYREEFPGKMPDAYERLLLDVLQGDASLFTRSDEVELAWRIVDPVVAAWEGDEQAPLHIYEQGCWGPDASTRWMYAQGRQWFDACPVLRK